MLWRGVRFQARCTVQGRLRSPGSSPGACLDIGQTVDADGDGTFINQLHPLHPVGPALCQSLANFLHIPS